ncbi:KICSTOR complex protein [Biomphalaria glabrata]
MRCVQKKQVEDRQVEDRQVEDRQEEDRQVKDRQVKDRQVEDRQEEDRQVEDRQVEDRQVEDRQVEDRQEEDRQVEDRQVEDRQTVKDTDRQTDLDLTCLRNTTSGLSLTPLLLTCLSPYSIGRPWLLDRESQVQNWAEKMSSKESVLGCPNNSSVTHEESVLEHYFQLLSQSNFDKAKELVDNEKDGHKFSTAASWGETLQCLSQLATAERSYCNLVFLGQKRFTQIVRSKDSAKSIYSMLLQEFQRMETFLLPHGDRERSSSAETDKLLAHISGQLSFFVRGRLKMIEFFEQLSSLGSLKQWMNFEDLVMILEEIVKDHMKGFHHPLVVSLKTVFCLECESLCHMLNAQIKISSWNFLQATMELYQAHAKLNEWGSKIPIKEVKSTFGRSSSKSSPYPPIYTWMYKLKGHLLSKFGIYFYGVLGKQTIPIELKANLSKAPEDIFNRIQAFHKKSDASNIYLILDTQNLQCPVGDGGYHHPQKYVEERVGLASYQPIFSFPGERSIYQPHWPNIIMLVDHSRDQIDKIYFFMEKRPQSSYFISQIEPKIFLVVIFEGKKNEKDSGINTFMLDLSSQLRCQTIMSSLKNFARS